MLKDGKPLVSVILPTYNRASNLEKIVKIIQEQTYNNIEIVIADDCSGDNTEAIVLGLMRRYGNIKYVRRDQNMGAYANYYRAICADISGQYAFWHSDDDFITDNAWISDAVELFLENMDVALVHAGFFYYHTESGTMEPTLITANRIEYFERFLEDFSPRNYMFHTFIYNVELVSRYLDSSSIIASHYIHILESIFMSIIGKKVGYICRNVMAYSLHAEQCSGREHTDILSLATASAQTFRMYDRLSKVYHPSLSKKRLEEFVLGLHESLKKPYATRKLEFIDRVLNRLSSFEGIKIIYGNGILGKNIMDICNKKNINIDFVFDDLNGNDSIAKFKKLKIQQPKIFVLATMEQTVAFSIVNKILHYGFFIGGVDELLYAEDF